jgi:prolyl 4-hydroxylase
MIPAPVVASDTPSHSTTEQSRTSSTCFLNKHDPPFLMEKCQALTGKPIAHMEKPQVGRYQATEKYDGHYDAVDMSTPIGESFDQNGGQRLVTVIVYLNDVEEGGNTFFSSLDLRIKPVRGTCAVFFPGFTDRRIDTRLLHTAEPAVDGHIKWVSQVWIRENDFN